MPRRTAIGLVAAALAGLTLSVAAPVGAVGQPQRPAADPLGVYFRADAVGRSQLRLVLSTCGTERWTVKTGADDDRSRVHGHPTRTTIRALRRKAEPDVKPQTLRVAPVELTTYRLRAVLTEFVREADGDDHLVLSDRHGRTIIAEIPDPACVAGISPLKGHIKRARKRFGRRYDATTGFTAVHDRVTVESVGFFDYFHGQTGMAPNNLELHPVTRIRWR